MCRHGRQSWDAVESWPISVLFRRYDNLLRLLELEADALED